MQREITIQIAVKLKQRNAFQLFKGKEGHLFSPRVDILMTP